MCVLGHRRYSWGEIGSSCGGMSNLRNQVPTETRLGLFLGKIHVLNQAIAPLDGQPVIPMFQITTAFAARAVGPVTVLSGKFRLRR